MPDNLLPEGFKDEVSNQAAIEHKYKNKIIDLFQSYGYELVKTPLIEFVDKINKINTLKIKVKKDQKELSLRDDITMQIARLSSTRLSKKPRPLKICYYGEVVRDKGSMLRPERQFLQIMQLFYPHLFVDLFHQQQLFYLHHHRKQNQYLL